MPSSHKSRQKIAAILAVSAVVVLGVWGCSQPRERVFVDLAKVERMNNGPLTIQDSTAPTRVPAVSSTVVFRGFRSYSYDKKEIQRQELQIQRVLAQNRARAYENLRDALLRTFERTLEREQTEKEAGLSDRRLELVRTLDQSIEAHFETYSRKRWPVVSELSLIVGYPLPNWTQIDAPDPAKVWEFRQYEKAKSLYAELEGVDRDYRAAVRSETALFELELEKLYLGVNAEIGRLRQIYAQAALDIAKEQLEKMDKSQTVSLDPSEVPPLSKLSPRQSQIQTGSVLVEKPQPIGTESPMADSREAMEEDLQLWADQRGYLLMDKPGTYRDETESFVAWRRSIRLGR